MRALCMRRLVACGCLLLLIGAGGRAALGDAAPVSPTLYGLSGLIRVPTADTVRDGIGSLVWTTTMHTPDRSIGAHSTEAFGLGLFPQVEFAVSLGSEGVIPGNETWDISVHLKARLLEQRGLLPSLAVGVMDLGRNDHKLGTGFAVGTWTADGGRWSATLGAAAGGNHGLLAGLQWRPVRPVEVQAEYDTRRVNLGLVGHVSPRVSVRVADLSAGTTASVGYAFPLSCLPQRAPQPLAAEGIRRGGGDAMMRSGDDAGVLGRIRDELVAAGMEDIQVRLEPAAAGGTALVGAFENRRYTLCEQDALPVVLAAMAARAPGSVSTLEAQFKRRGIVVAECSVPLEAYRQYRGGQISAASFRTQVRIGVLPASRRSEPSASSTPIANASAGHADLALGAGLSTVVGTENGFLKYGLYARPELSVPLGRGLLAHGSWQAPVAGDLLQDVPERWSTYRSVIAYAFQPARGWLGQVVAGRFPLATTGAVLEVVRPVSARGMLRFVGGPATNARLQSKPYAIGEYWHLLPQWNAQLRLFGGRFLTADTGYGVDIVRFFGDVQVGLGVRDTSVRRVAVLQFSVPLSPRRQPQRPSTLRLRMANYLDHTTRSVISGESNFLYLLDRTGRELDLGVDLRSTFLDRGRLLKDSGTWFAR